MTNSWGKNRSDTLNQIALILIATAVQFAAIEEVSAQVLTARTEQDNSRSNSSSTNSVPTLDDGRRILRLKDGQEITWDDLFSISQKDLKAAEQVLQKLPDENKRTEKRAYWQWYSSKLDLSKKKQEVELLRLSLVKKQQDDEILRLDEINRRLTDELVERMTRYIEMAERGQLVPDNSYIESALLPNPIYDELLKGRARRLLLRKAQKD